ncbi:hypothetical protein [Duganella callida]|uniref:Uncharacterized protein n=1 Tax=Duganella callida TaxID=2561932 RepID=A0A4Y9SQ94_9BURK|nr:hypothetical protein [Duganella callida]TFW28840.1 hypothetical protein E4L98_04955 [Duganella callida]
MYDRPIVCHLSCDLLIKLCDATGEGCFGDKSYRALCDAVRDWLAHDHPAIDHPPRAKTGYQWKQIFLPEGTELRATIKGIARYATVEGNRILCNGQALSPSQFANADRVVRNAWRVIWLRLPGEDWERAANLRDSHRY